jgi:hypothetical protein
MFIAACGEPKKKHEGSVVINGYEGRTTIWPGKKVLYYPNSTSMHGWGSARSNSFGYPVEAEVVRITEKKVVIKITQDWSAQRGKEKMVGQYRICSVDSYYG